VRNTVERAVIWLDRYLGLMDFDDVSNNSLQIAREGEALSLVAFGVDASVSFIRAAAAAGAELCVVHHGISWGGGIKRLTGSEYRVVKAAMENNIALYAAHLPLDAHREVGNNFMLARHLGLVNLKREFSYHGNVIGVVGVASVTGTKKIGDVEMRLRKGEKVGVCSGGAGEFAVEAKKLGCDTFVTGEATWGDVVAAENVGMKMVLAGHYATETFGVKALSEKMSSELGVNTIFIEKK
jgi:dinuclear metal center YbgI/SA1388 family protein